MPYFKPLNLLYIHIPKTGGMSIEEYLYQKCNMERDEKNIYGYYYDRTNRIRVENERTLQHLTYNEIIEKKQWFDIEIGNCKNKDMKILVSIRNPFERIVSDLFWNKTSGVTKETTKEEFYQILYKYLYVDTDVLIDNHKTPQYKFIQNEYGLTIKNNIFFVRTENLREDMHKLGFTDFDIHINENLVKTDYQKYLNEDSIELIVNYYAADFLHFGYSTDLFKPSGKREKYQTTIVTAFISHVNKSKKLEDYITFGEKLLKLSESTPKIVFIDQSSYNDFFAHRLSEFPLTHFIIFELSEMYFNNLRHLLTDFNLITDNPEKDTVDYIFLQCYKTEWIRRAIEVNVFSSSQFIWMDFGIYHMIGDENIFKNGVMQMATKTHSKLRMATCKSREYECPYNVYKQLTWNFAGSVFGGDIVSLTTFADIVKEKILETIYKKNTIMWELCFWYLVKDVVPDLYDCYVCGHDRRILFDY